MKNETDIDLEEKRKLDEAVNHGLQIICPKIYSKEAKIYAQKYGTNFDDTLAVMVKDSVLLEVPKDSVEDWANTVTFCHTTPKLLSLLLILSQGYSWYKRIKEVEPDEPKRVHLALMQSIALVRSPSVWRHTKVLDDYLYLDDWVEYIEDTFSDIIKGKTEKSIESYNQMLTRLIVLADNFDFIGLNILSNMTEDETYRGLALNSALRVIQTLLLHPDTGIVVRPGQLDTYKERG